MNEISVHNAERACLQGTSKARGSSYIKLKHDEPGCAIEGAACPCRVAGKSAPSKRKHPIRNPRLVVVNRPTLLGCRVPDEVGACGYHPRLQEAQNGMIRSLTSGRK